MKIIIVGSSFYPYAIGGNELHIFFTAQKLSRKHNVTIIAGISKVVSREPLMELRDKVKFVLFRKLKVPLLSSIVFIFRSFFALMKIAKEADIIHAHQALSPIVAPCLINLLYGKAFIVTCHGSEIRVLHRNLFIKLVQRVMLARAKHIFCISKEIASILIGEYQLSANKISIISDGYDDELVLKLKQRLCKEEIAPEKRLVCVANLRPKKDHMTLLEGFSKVAQKLTYVHLYLIGDGILRPMLENYCIKRDLKNVHFLGKQSYEKTLEFVSKADIFILTSVEEAMSNAIIEALALGKPIIATRVGGIPEVIKDGTNGLLIPPRSPEHVAQAIDRLLHDSSLVEKLSKAAAESVEECSWSKIAENYETIYHLVKARG